MYAVLTFSQSATKKSSPRSP